MPGGGARGQFLEHYRFFFVSFFLVENYFYLNNNFYLGLTLSVTWGLVPWGWANTMHLKQG